MTASFRPVDQSAGHEPRGGDDIDHRAEDVLQRIHLVDVAQAEEAERGEHEDADARAEEAAIQGDGELESDGDPDGRDVRRGRAASRPAMPPEDTLEQEEDGGEEDEKGDERGEDFVARAGEENAAEQAAEQADGDEAPEPRPDRRDLRAKAEDAAGGADDERERAGGVGDDRRGAEEAGGQGR